MHEIPLSLSLPKLLPYSSTEVRARIAQGDDTSHMLHPDVAQYIKERQHYTLKNNEA